MNITDSASIISTIDFNQFTLENIYLFKSYLFVKIIKKKLPEKNFQNFLILNKIENKLLLKIIDLCLINNKSIHKNEYKYESNEKICELIYNRLLDEYKDLDEDENDSKSEIRVSDDFESDFMGLISQIKTFTSLVENKLDSENNEIPSLKGWLFKTFCQLGRLKKSLSTTGSLNQVSYHQNEKILSLKIFSLTDKMKIEDLILKILGFTFIRASFKFNSLKSSEFNTIPRLLNKEYLDDLSQLIELNKQLYNDFSDNYVFNEQENLSFYQTNESESQMSVINNSINLHKSSSLTSNKISNKKRKQDYSMIEMFEKELEGNVSTKLSDGYPNSIKTKRYRHQSEYDHDQNSIVSNQNENVRSLNEQVYTDDEDNENSANNFNEDKPNCSRKFMVFSNPAFDHSYKSNKFLSKSKSTNVEKYISMPFDSISRFHPLTLSVEKLPGIGTIYTQRLQNNKVNTFGDLVDIYQLKCKCDEEKFCDQLKEMTAMKIDSVLKIINLIRNYSIQIKSAL